MTNPDRITAAFQELTAALTGDEREEADLLLADLALLLNLYSQRENLTVLRIHEIIRQPQRSGDLTAAYTNLCELVENNSNVSVDDYFKKAVGAVLGGMSAMLRAADTYR